MSYFSFVGDFDDPEFHWDSPADATSGGNLPARVVPQPPWTSLGIGVDWVRKMIDEGRYEGRVLDWGAWGLKMTGGEIRALLTDPEDVETLSVLDPAKAYVLVVAENA